jgi:hypothetical protein
MKLLLAGRKAAMDERERCGRTSYLASRLSPQMIGRNVPSRLIDTVYPRFPTNPLMGLKNPNGCIRDQDSNRAQHSRLSDTTSPGFETSP